jgi:hypothetical protein
LIAPGAKSPLIFHPLCAKLVERHDNNDHAFTSPQPQSQW